MVEPLDAERSGYRSGRPSSEPSRLGIVPTIGLMAILVGGLVVAAPAGFATPDYLSYACVGALLAIRRSRNPIGWLLVSIRFGFLATGTPSVVDIAAVAAGTAGTAGGER